MGPTQSLIKWVPGAPSLQINRPGRLVQKSKNEWSCTSTPPIRLHGLLLSLKKQYRNNFTFTFYRTLDVLIRAVEVKFQHTSFKPDTEIYVRDVQ